METQRNSPLPPSQKSILNWINRRLNEGTMGFFALIALTLALIPLFFPLYQHPRTQNYLYYGQWGVVGIFVFDYVTHFIAAKSKWRYARSRVRISYVIIIVLAVASLLESVPDAFVAAPVLHLFNVIAALLFGMRASAVAVEHLETESETAANLPRKVYVTKPDEDATIQETTWLELIKWTNEPSNMWFHAESIGTQELGDLSHATSIPEPVLKSCVVQENYPRIFFFTRTVLISLWLRLPETEGNAGTYDVPLMLILNPHGLITLCPASMHLHHFVKERLSDKIAAKLPFNLRVLYAVFDFVLTSKQERIDANEQLLRRLENYPPTAFHSGTLQQVYNLKSHVTSLRADLWRLKELFTRMESGKIHLPGMDKARHAEFDYLGEKADFLFHTAEQLRESVISLIDLQISRSGYEMNKFMRLLAVISAIGFIPAVVSGMLGMNIAGAPWQWTLPQVGFIVSLICVFCLYYFVVRGWLR